MKFTRAHQWVVAEGGTATVGLTAWAAKQLGDVVSLDLPKVGGKLAAGARMAGLECAKVACEAPAPVSGEVVAVNASLADQPEIVSEDPEGEGWFARIRLSDPSELDALMDRPAYEQFLGTL